MYNTTTIIILLPINAHDNEKQGVAEKTEPPFYPANAQEKCCTAQGFPSPPTPPPPGTPPSGRCLKGKSVIKKMMGGREWGLKGGGKKKKEKKKVIINLSSTAYGYK